MVLKIFMFINCFLNHWRLLLFAVLVGNDEYVTSWESKGLYDDKGK